MLQQHFGHEGANYPTEDNTCI